MFSQSVFGQMTIFGNWFSLLKLLIDIYDFSKNYSRANLLVRLLILHCLQIDVHFSFFFFPKNLIKSLPTEFILLIYSISEFIWLNYSNSI